MNDVSLSVWQEFCFNNHTYIYIFKMLKQNYENNCLSCISQRLVQVGSVLGISSLVMQCTHDNCQICRVDQSRILHFISICVASLLICVGSAGIYDFFFVSSCDINKESDASFLIHRSITFSIGLFVSCGVYNYKLAFNIAQTNINDLAYCSSIGRCYFITKDQVKSIRHEILRILLVISCLCILMCLYELVFNGIQGIAFPLGVYAWAINHYFLYQVSMIKHRVVMALYEDTKRIIHYRTNYGILKNDPKSNAFSGEILKMMIIRKMMYYSCLKYVKLLGLCCLISTLSQIFMAVLVLFTTVVMVLNQTILVFNRVYLIVVFGWVLISVTAYWCLCSSEALANSVMEHKKRKFGTHIYN